MSVRIDFGIEGGLAAFPGLAKPVRIDCASLPPAEAGKLEALVRKSDFFHLRLPATTSTPDARTYSIEIDDGSRCRSLRIDEPIADEALRDLVAEIRRHAGRLRTARNR